MVDYMDNNKEDYQWENNQEPAAVSEEEPDAAPEIDTASLAPRRRRKRKKKRYLLKLCIVLLLCAGVYVLLHSSLFMVEKIQVSDTAQFTAEEIQKTAGIKEGMQMFGFGAGKAEDKLEKDPHIAKADISRKLFSGLVVINIDERLEVASIRQDKQFIVLDKDGLVLGALDKRPKVVLLKGLTVTEAEEKQPVKVKEKAAYKRALSLLEAIENSGLYFKTLDVSSTVVKGYFTDKLYCTGTAKNIIEGIEKKNLQAIVYDLAEKKIKKGIISVGENQYYSFLPTKGKKEKKE